MKEAKKVCIEVYDDEGTLCESLGGRMTYDEVRENMINILRNDGIPVIRSRHRVDTHKDDVKKVEELLAKNGKTVVHAPAPENRIEPLPLPLMIQWEVDGVKFKATGKAEDVLDAQAEFLDGLEYAE